MSDRKPDPGMLSDNHSGIIWSLAGLAILILSGVFLSILVDGKHKSSRVRNNFTESLAANEHEISGLKQEAEALNARLISAEKRADSNSSEVRTKVLLRSQLGSSISQLRARKAEMIRSIPELRQEFDSYRKKYRDQAWNDAVGEEIESILLKSGRHFESVRITRVTPVGLEISHPDGTARIDAQELSREYRDRFQWDDAERERTIETERKNRERLAHEARESPPEPESPDGVPSGIDLEKTRAEVRLLQGKVLQLKAELLTAENESRYAKNRSVPGSLRTWAEQADVLAADLIKAEARLSLAKEKLRAVSPNDSLLRPPTTNQ